MSKKHFFFTAFLFSTLHLTYAQDSTKTKQLDEVVVTATKYPVKQSMTGKVVTVIGKEEVEKNSGRTLTQLLNEKAGVVINGALNNPGSVPTIFMRGAASGRALILIDGVPAYDPSQINNEFDLNFISINEIERIEVCRGAQSTLYGSDAIAGVINIITLNRDVSKPVNVKATVAGGTQGTFKGNAQLYGKLDKFRYSLRFSKLVTDGFSAAYDSSGKNDFEKDGYNGNNVHGQLLYQPNERLALKTFFQYNQYENDIDAGGFTDDHDFHARNKNKIAGAGFNYRLDAVSLTGNYQYSEINRDYIDDSAYVGGFSKYSSNEYYGKSQFVELYASTHLGGGFTLLQGADYRFANMNNKYFAISSFGPYRSSFKDTVVSQGSLYASMNFNGLDSNLNIEVGGRLNVHSRYGSNYTYTFNPSYKLSEQLRVFGSVATAFKSPGLFQLYDGLSGNRNLKAETSINYEVGFQQQHRWIDNRLVFFYREIENGIDYNYVTYKYFNFFQQIARGLEWEMNVRPLDFLSVHANYTYLSITENTQDRKLLNKDTAYRYAIRRPAHNINASVNVQVTPALSFTANIKHVSRRRDLGGFMAADVLLAGYTLLGAHVDYQLSRHFRLFADLQNITNRKFFDTRGYTAIPFTAIGGVTFNL
jgi:vitamin B12 transporter